MAITTDLKTKPGQALVEMAIIAPLLIFMVIGIFEVAWALRGYLVLINANREAARFAVRPGYLNFETAIEPGWERVKEQFLSAAGGIDIDLEEKGTLILAYIEVDAGAYTATNCMTNYTATIKLPATNPTYTITYGEPRVSRFDYYALAAELERYNREQLCRLVPIGDFSRDDGLIVAESWFEQPMLFGFPLISNPLSDPVPLYGHTIMRRIEALRGNGQGN